MYVCVYIKRVVVVFIVFYALCKQTGWSSCGGGGPTPSLEQIVYRCVNRIYFDTAFLADDPGLRPVTFFDGNDDLLLLCIYLLHDEAIVSDLPPRRLRFRPLE